jgi:hypothetical protein
MGLYLCELSYLYSGIHDRLIFFSVVVTGIYVICVC